MIIYKDFYLVAPGAAPAYLYKDYKIAVAMDLRELKREVEALPALAEYAQKLQEKLALIEGFSPELRKKAELKKSLVEHYVDGLAAGEQIQRQLQQQARLLVELKLAQLQQDKEKAASIKEQLLRDDWCNFSHTLELVKALEEQTARLCVFYYDLTDFLQRNAGLEHSVTIASHQALLKEIVSVVKRYKKAGYQLGKEFVELSK